MAEPTLQEIFGSNATQDANTITIAKSDLPGLIADANNAAEKILVAMLLKWRQYLSEENFNGNADQNTYFGTGYSGFVNRGVNSEQYRTDQLTITLAKLDTGTTINPNDY